MQDYWTHFDVVYLLDFDSVLDLYCDVLAAEISLCLVLDRMPCLYLCLDQDSIFFRAESPLLAGHRDCLCRLEAGQRGLQAWREENLLSIFQPLFW
jgi:hypothetical protein